MAIAFEHRIDVACPPSQVFAVLDNFAARPKWLKACTGLAKQGTGANKVGDKLRYAYFRNGKHGVMDGVIVAHDQDSRLCCKYYDRMYQVVVDFRLAPQDDGSQLLHRIEITPHCLMARLMSLWIRVTLPKQTRDSMEALRALLADGYQH